MKNSQHKALREDPQFKQKIEKTKKVKQRVQETKEAEEEIRLYEETLKG